MSRNATIVEFCYPRSVPSAAKRGKVSATVRHFARIATILAISGCSSPLLGPGCTLDDGVSRTHDDVCPVHRYDTTYTALYFAPDFSLHQVTYRVEWDRS